MNILTWLKEVTTGGHPEFIGSGGMTFAEGEEQFHGLNMKAALDGHVDWTHRLERKLNGEKFGGARGGDRRIQLQLQVGQLDPWRNVGVFTSIPGARLTAGDSLSGSLPIEGAQQACAPASGRTRFRVTPAVSWRSERSFSQLSK